MIRNDIPRKQVLDFINESDRLDEKLYAVIELLKAIGEEEVIYHHTARGIATTLEDLLDTRAAAEVVLLERDPAECDEDALAGHIAKLRSEHSDKESE